MSGNSSSEGAIWRSIREFQHVLDTTPVVGQLCRSWEIPELERLIVRYPDEARALLAALEAQTRSQDSAPRTDP